MLHVAENPVKSGWLVPEIQAVEGFAKQKKTKEFFSFSLALSQKTVFVSFDPFCLIISHVQIDYQIYSPN